jgi:DNA-binding transcriptional LysR family regulator
MMRVLVAISDEGSFAGAARRLRTSPAAITRAIAALEARLGIQLLLRSTRQIKTTERGQQYLDAIRRILSDIDAADDMAQGIQRSPGGNLSITAPSMFGVLCVMPAMVDYLQRFPGTSVSALFLERFVHLLEEDIDIGVHIGPVLDPSLIAIPVGWVRPIVCAAPAYLMRYGTPVAPEQLMQHHIIVNTLCSAPIDWYFGKGSGTVVKVRPTLIVTTGEAALHAACRGVGIVRLPSYQVRQHLTLGNLVQVLDEFESAAQPINVMHLKGRQSSPAVGRFIELLVERLRADPALNEIADA